MDPLDPAQFQPVTANDFATPSFSNVQGSSSSTAPAPTDNPDPLTNGEVPAPIPAPRVDQLQPVSAQDFAEPSVLDKIKSGAKALNDMAGDTADRMVRPFVGQQAIDEAPAAIHQAVQSLKEGSQKIQNSPSDPLWATAELALGGNPDQPTGAMLKDVAARGYFAATAGAGKVDEAAADVGHLALKAAGVAPYAYDKIAGLVSGTPQATAYDWWNRNELQPSQQITDKLGQQSDAYAEQSGAAGQGMQIAGQVGSQLAEMSIMGPELAAEKLATALPAQGFSAGVKMLKEGLAASARYSAIPAMVNASKTQEAVYKQTGDPQAAVIAAITSGATTTLVNAIPLSVSGPLAYKVLSAGASGSVGSEASRQINNAAMPANMQEPFTWKGVLQNFATTAAIGGAFAEREQEDYQTAYIRYNGIQKAADTGNAGARKTADVIDTLSQVTNNIDNSMVDAAVHGVTVSNAKMAKPHAQLQAEDPRYAAIFKATQNGPAAVDPQTGEAIARDAYASEVATNTSFDKYTELTGQKNQSIQLAKNAATMMDVAHKIVPAPELDILSRWAAYDQPSQLQFNKALQDTIESKQAPDYVHDKYGEDYHPDGVPNESAYARDHATQPDTYDAFYAPNPKVEKALQEGGIRYYRMADGRLGIRGGNAQYTTNVFSHVFDTTGGIVPLAPGEKHVQETAAHPEQEIRSEVTGSDTHEGQPAGPGRQAETGQPEQPHGQQNGDEGHGPGVGPGRVVGHEGAGPVDENAQDLTPRAQPVAEALAKAGLSAPISPTGRVTIDPAATQAGKTIDAVATDAAEHPESVRKPLTDGQRAAGNYPVGKVLLESPKGNVPVDIENPIGSVRRSLPGAAKKFSSKMNGAHYGRIPNTIGADGDPLDVFLTPHAHDDTLPVAVISQHHPDTGTFDELKVVMGAKSKGEALSVYGRQYPTGMVDKLAPEGKKNVVMMSREKFVNFIKSGATDVPPHPVSGMPMMRLREHAEFEGNGGAAKPEDLAAKVEHINAKHGTSLIADHQSVRGTIPKAKAEAIHRSLSRVEGYADSTLNGQSMAAKETPIPAFPLKPKAQIGEDGKIRMIRPEVQEKEERHRTIKERLADKTADTLKERLKKSHEPRLMFAGEKAKTADIGALAHAKKMEQEEKLVGTSDKDIETLTHGMTGWSRGADGKWRFEINDAASRLKPEALDPKSEIGKALRSDKSVPVGQIMDHPALFEAYPHLAKDIHVKVEPKLPADAGAMYDPDTKTILFHELSDYDKTGDESVHSIILHELQHDIQYSEGHATGGNPHQFLGPMREQKAALIQTHTELMAKREALVDQWVRDNIHYDDFSDKLDKFVEEDPAVKEINDHLQRVSEQFTKQGFNSYQSMMNAAVGKYMRLAGEMEAYNTQARQAMSEAERRAIPPSITEKYPRAEQISTFDKAGMAEHRLSDEEVARRAEVHHAAVQVHVDEIRKAWKGAPPIHVINDRAQIPAEAKAYLDHFLPDGQDPAGMMHNGHVYVFSHSLEHPDDAGRTLLHEAIGHYGLHSSKTIGKDLPRLLDEIHASVKDTPEFKRIAKEYQRLYGRTKPLQRQRNLAEEYLARIAENGKDPTTWQKFVAFIHDVMRRLGMKPKWSEGDIASMLAKVHRDVREGRVSDHGLEVPQTIFSGKDGTATSTYRGTAGEGTITLNKDGSRTLDIGALHATLRTSLLNGRKVNSVSDIESTGPDALASLARFTQEEGRAAVAIGKANVTRAQIEASGVPFKERPGFYELTHEAPLADNPMFSLRNRAKGSPEIEQILDKTIDHSELNMTPWDRLQKTMRDFRDDIQHGDTALDLKQSYVDALAPIEKYERRANGGLLLDAAQSAYKAAWMAKNNEQITAGVLKTGVPEYKNGSFTAVPGRRGFMDMLEPLYKNTPDGKPLDALFEGYLVGLRANELIKQTNPDGTPKEKLLTQDEIDKLIAQEQQYPQFKKVAADLQAFNHQLLDLAVDRGSMSKEVADTWKQNMYVPFYRSMDNGESTAWRGNGSNTLSGKKVTSMRIHGSDKKIEPVIENIVKNTSAILDKIYSNEAMRRIVGLTDGIGMERIKMPMRAIKLSADEAISLLHKAGIQVDKSNLTPADLDTLTTMFRPQKPVGPDIVSVVENGKNLYYRVTDPSLYRAVTAFQDIGRFDKILNVLLGGTKRLYTVGTTLDPRFMFRIMMKDAMQSWIQTGTNPNMFKNMASNAKDIMTDSHFLNELRVAGYNGNEYYKIDEVRDQMERLHGKQWTVLNTPASLYRAYKHVGWMSEQMSRMSIAKHTLDQGGSMAEAAWQGQNTLNWQKHGDGRAAQLIMRGAPFLNAHIQGLTRLYDGMLGRDVTMNRSRAVTSFLLKGLSLAVPTMLLNLYNQQNKAFERLPDEAKDLYWHVFVGDKHYAIPKPFEAGAMMATMPERVMRVLQGKDTKKTFVDAMGTVVNEMFGLDPIPQALLPVLENVANRQQLGSSVPIVSQHLQDLEPGAQQTASTSPTVTTIAHHMPHAAPDMLRSPLRLQHLIHGYTSALGLYALQAADAMARATGYAPPAPASRFGGPISTALAHMGNVEKPESDTRNRYMDEVYSAQHDADAAAKTITTYIKEGHLQEAREAMQDNRTALQYRNELHAISSKMGQLRALEQQIYLSPSMTPEAKRAKLDNINKMRTRMLDRAAPMLDLVTDFH